MQLKIKAKKNPSKWRGNFYKNELILVTCYKTKVSSIIKISG